jgi:hypothetical protein
LVQGLYSGWKQPISYLFAKNTVKSKYLKILIAEIIKKLQDAGLTVVCTVCDQAATNVRALQLLKLDSNTHLTKPYFKVNLKKIVCLFDVPHLLKSLRNALLKYTVYYGETKIAKFTYLRQAYEFDKNKCQNVNVRH